MRRYILYFALIILLTNGGYALSQVATGKDDFISRPLLLGSTTAAIFALFVIKRRIRQLQGGRGNERRR